MFCNVIENFPQVAKARLAFSTYPTEMVKPTEAFAVIPVPLRRKFDFLKIPYGEGMF